MRGLALTFDDGPDPHWTARLLDRLAQHAARVTFFPISARALRAPELIGRMLDEGHGVGLHCHEHIRHSQRDEASLRADTDVALSALAALGVKATLWRTPWGDVAPWTASVAAAHQLELVRWSVDTHDWRGDSAETMFAATRASLVPGAIVLAHDGLGPGARRENPAETLEYVDRVIALAASQSLALRALEPGGHA
jgi:peptidoglycan/xylan/chitin deacetylase (PgdA/CDA1 family)